jgi:hypothetical protein
MIGAKKAICIALCAMMALCAIPAMAAPADAVKPGIDFNGAHYTLNILGKKNVGGDFDNPDRHTMFVPLDGDANITMTQGDEFAVLDGNGMDGDAIFQIPSGEAKNFKVYVVSLGKPGNGVDIDYPDGWIYNNDTGLWYVEIATVHVVGHSKKPVWTDATEWFYMEYEWADGGMIWEGYMWNVPTELFDETGYWWDMQGCDQHLQVRFYPY